ncbi:hypothetical protein ABIB48_002653 [Arthrobacter sp. UYCu511]|uniref:hypothetical protein n=1 Tax=Arthrobacter sp. UYCu511 TaxID=3156337 RepID=UPI00339296BC
MARQCKHNSAHEIAEDADPRKVYCSPSCRVAAFHKRNEVRAEILARMTAALAAGADPVVLAEIQREAERALRR